MQKFKTDIEQLLLRSPLFDNLSLQIIATYKETTSHKNLPSVILNHEEHFNI